MSKQHVKWKKVRFTNQQGNDFEHEVPEMIDHWYRGNLISSILEMPPKEPICFDDAVRMAGEKYLSSKVGRGPGESIWHLSHFVEWISSLGYHIELTGDEFEASITQPLDN